MHIGANPHNPHADGGNNNGNQTNPTISIKDTFDWQIWLKEDFSFLHRYGIQLQQRCPRTRKRLNQ